MSVPAKKVKHGLERGSVHPLISGFLNFLAGFTGSSQDAVHVNLGEPMTEARAGQILRSKFPLTRFIILTAIDFAEIKDIDRTLFEIKARNFQVCVAVSSMCSGTIILKPIPCPVRVSELPHRAIPQRISGPELDTISQLGESVKSCNLANGPQFHISIPRIGDCRPESCKPLQQALRSSVLPLTCAFDIVRGATHARFPRSQSSPGDGVLFTLSFHKREVFIHAMRANICQRPLVRQLENEIASPIQHRLATQLFEMFSPNAVGQSFDLLGGLTSRPNGGFLPEVLQALRLGLNWLREAGKVKIAKLVPRGMRHHYIQGQTEALIRARDQHAFVFLFETAEFALSADCFDLKVTVDLLADTHIGRVILAEEALAQAQTADENGTLVVNGGISEDAKKCVANLENARMDLQWIRDQERISYTSLNVK